MTTSMLLAQAEPSAPGAVMGLALLLLGVIGIVVVVRSRMTGTPLAAAEPQYLVPWGAGAVLVAIVIYLGCQSFIHPLAGVLYDGRRTADMRPFDELDVDAPNSQAVVATYQAFTWMSGLAMLAIAAVVGKWKGATPQDFGLGTRRFARDVALGLKGFVVIVPGVLLLQALLSVLWMPTKHPLVLAWKEHGDVQVLLWTAIVAVIVAPIVEEFLFRGIIQGWLQRLFEGMKPEPVAAADEVGLPADDDPTVGDEPRTLASRSLTAWQPILLSAALFALVHLPNGPDAVPIFFLGLGLGYLYRQTHSIWPGVTVHALMNGWSVLTMALLRERL